MTVNNEISAGFKWRCWRNPRHQNLANQFLVFIILTANKIGFEKENFNFAFAWPWRWDLILGSYAGSWD